MVPGAAADRVRGASRSCRPVRRCASSTRVAAPGRLLDELRDYGHVTGLDLNPDSVEIARSRGHEDVVQGPVEQLPWPDETFDLVISLDMVEHTADDRVTLRELRRVTRQGGYFLMTVPALRALWSSHDVFNNHFRRYDRRMMRALAAETGWTIERMTYFNSLLLPPAAAVRLLQRVRHRDVDGRTATATSRTSPSTAGTAPTSS